MSMYVCVWPAIEVMYAIPRAVSKGKDDLMYQGAFAMSASQPPQGLNMRLKRGLCGDPTKTSENTESKCMVYRHAHTIHV